MHIFWRLRCSAHVNVEAALLGAAMRVGTHHTESRIACCRVALLRFDIDLAVKTDHGQGLASRAQDACAHRHDAAIALFQCHSPSLDGLHSKLHLAARFFVRHYCLTTGIDALIPMFADLGEADKAALA